MCNRKANLTFKGYQGLLRKSLTSKTRENFRFLLFRFGYFWLFGTITFLKVTPLQGPNSGIVIYNKKVIFGLHSVSGTDFQRSLEFPVIRVLKVSFVYEVTYGIRF